MALNWGNFSKGQSQQSSGNNDMMSQFQSFLGNMQNGGMGNKSQY